MALRFLFDECVASSLVELAHARGYEAYHVAHRGLAGANDRELLSVLIAEELVLVTNNGPDFTALIAPGTVHPGLVIFVTQVRPRLQALLFTAALDHLGAREDLINRVIEVDVDEVTRRALTPNARLADDAWARLAAELRPTVREFDLPAEAEPA